MLASWSINYKRNLQLFAIMYAIHIYARALMARLTDDACNNLMLT